MQEGKIVRFEEITRCPIEIQDILLSILSDRVMSIPELEGAGRTLYAKTGFNVIATANTRDRGVNDMSAALKRRFNFETVQPIVSLDDEMALVQRESEKLLKRAEITISLKPEVIELLVTTFHELRAGQTGDGKAIEPLTTAMSTAEAVSTAYAAGLHAYYYGAREVEPAHLVQHLVGSALKDAPDDVKKLAHYFNHVVKGRRGRAWSDYYEARKHLS
jgi:MoxR-like ATPase